MMMLDLMFKRIEFDKSTVEYNNVHKNATLSKFDWVIAFYDNAGLDDQGDKS